MDFAVRPMSRKVGDDYFGKILGNTIKRIGISDEGLIYDKGANTRHAIVHTMADRNRDFSFWLPFFDSLQLRWSPHTPLADQVPRRSTGCRAVSLQTGIRLPPQQRRGLCSKWYRILIHLGDILIGY